MKYSFRFLQKQFPLSVILVPVIDQGMKHTEIPGSILFFIHKITIVHYLFIRMIKRFVGGTCSLIILQLLIHSNGYGQITKKPAPSKTATQKTVQKSPQKAAPKAPFATAQEIEEGKLLIPKLDCFACHKVNEKQIGPAYVDVAKKYPQADSTVALLVNKILHGGSGTWGQLPMAPHPNLPADDAKKIVKYILSLSAEK
jgi:cytochrome c